MNAIYFWNIISFQKQMFMNSKESLYLTMNKLLEDYRSFMVLKNFSSRTNKTYVSILDCFFRYCELHFPNEMMN